jgi:hypothetical protein
VGAGQWEEEGGSALSFLDSLTEMCMLWSDHLGT